MSAMKALVPGQDPVVYGTYATSIFLVGWATGGLFFGVLGDRIGRAKTMMITILAYSICTGLSALSQTFWDFAFYRFITGLGVGGEFAVGVALVSEVMPTKARAGALGLLQALSTVGNIGAALLGLGMAKLEAAGLVGAGNSWRWMFVVGAFPALLALAIRSRMKEPERWLAMKNSGELARRSAFTYGELFRHPVWRKRAIVGMLLACAGVIGLWGIGFFTPELVRTVLAKSFRAEGVPADQISTKVDAWASGALLMLQIGGFLGMMTFSYLAQLWGRKPAFALGFILAGVSTACAFGYFDSRSQIFWLIPIMGFCQLSLFAIYAIYLPELFPTHLRSTGTSFCYNVGRFIAAFGPPLLGMLKLHFHDHPEPMRPAAITMCAVFLIGLCVLPFAPETNGQPLPEEERGGVH
jgi:MFS family permease